MNKWPCPKLDLPRCPFGAPAAPCTQSECITCFAHTFFIGTPRATSPRGCFKGLVRTLNTWPCPKLNLPSPSAWLALLAPSQLELHTQPVQWVVSRGLSSNHKYMALSAVILPPSKGISRSTQGKTYTTATNVNIKQLDQAN